MMGWLVSGICAREVTAGVLVGVKPTVARMMGFAIRAARTGRSSMHLGHIHRPVVLNAHNVNFANAERHLLAHVLRWS